MDKKFNDCFKLWLNDLMPVCDGHFYSLMNGIKIEL